MAPPAFISLHDMGNNQRKTIHPERRGETPLKGSIREWRGKLTALWLLTKANP